MLLLLVITGKAQKRTLAIRLFVPLTPLRISQRGTKCILTVRTRPDRPIHAFMYEWVHPPLTLTCVIYLARRRERRWLKFSSWVRSSTQGLKIQFFWTNPTALGLDQETPNAHWVVALTLQSLSISTWMELPLKTVFSVMKGQILYLLDPGGSCMISINIRFDGVPPT